MDVRVADRHAALHAVHRYACPYLDALSGAAKPTTPTATASGKIHVYFRGSLLQCK